VADIRTRGPFNALQFRLPFLSADSERRTPARPRVPSLIISSFRQRRRKENEKKRKKQERKNKKEREKGERGRGGDDGKEDERNEVADRWAAVSLGFSTVSDVRCCDGDVPLFSQSSLSLSLSLSVPLCPFLSSSEVPLARSALRDGDEKPRRVARFTLDFPFCLSLFLSLSLSIPRHDFPRQLLTL